MRASPSVRRNPPRPITKPAARLKAVPKTVARSHVVTTVVVTRVAVSRIVVRTTAVTQVAALSKITNNQDLHLAVAAGA